MASVDMTMIAVAIPALERSLDASLNWIGWAITANQLTQIVVLPVVGKLSDELGRKCVFLFCLTTFIVGSLLSGLAPNVGLLIVFRVIQAIGAGGLLPSAYGIVTDQFPDRRSQTIGLFSSILPIGGIIGPNVGGWILEHWSWRELFFMNVPIGIAIVVGVHFLWREQRSGGKAPDIDYAGLALFAGGMITLMYAMTRAGTDARAWQSPALWALVASAMALFLLFIRQEHRATHPIVEIKLLARRPFLPVNIYNFFLGAYIFGYISFVPYFAVVQYQMSAAQSGAVLTPRSLAMIGMSLVTSLALLRLGYRIPMIVGMLLMSLALVLISFGWSQATIGPFVLDGFWILALEIGITGLGMGLSAPSSNNANLDLLPERAAALTGLRGMFRMSGGIIAISGMVLALSFFDDKAAGLRALFLVLGIMLPLINIPLCLMIPDSARQRRLARHSANANGMKT